MEEFQTLGGDLDNETCYTGKIAAGPVEAGDKASFNRVDGSLEHDRYGLGCSFRGQGRRRLQRNDDSNLSAEQITR